jgi:hypothetical protein
MAGGESGIWKSIGEKYKHTPTILKVQEQLPFLRPIIPISTAQEQLPPSLISVFAFTKPKD